MKRAHSTPVCQRALHITTGDLAFVLMPCTFRLVFFLLFGSGCVVSLIYSSVSIWMRHVTWNSFETYSINENLFAIHSRSAMTIQMAVNMIIHAHTHTHCGLRIRNDQRLYSQPTKKPNIYLLDAVSSIFESFKKYICNSGFRLLWLQCMCDLQFAGSFARSIAHALSDQTFVNFIRCCFEIIVIL